MVFALLFAKVLERREGYPERNVPKVPWTGTRGAILSLRTTTRRAWCRLYTASELAQDVRHITGITFDAVTAHGLLPNLGPRKSAAILLPRGCGAKHAPERIFTAGRGKLHILREGSAAVLMDAVHSYRHLGSTLAHSGSLVDEVKSRLGIARSSFGEGRKKSFGVPTYPSGAPGATVPGARSLCTPAFAAGFGHFQQGLTAMCRQLLRISHDQAQNWSREEIFSACGLPSPQDLLRLERLAIPEPDGAACAGCGMAWALLQHHREGVDAFRHAGVWLHTAVSATCGLADFEKERPSWVDLMCHKVRQWKGLLKRATTWHVQHRLGAVYSSSGWPSALGRRPRTLLPAQPRVSGPSFGSRPALPGMRHHLRKRHAPQEPSCVLTPLPAILGAE